MYIAMIIAFLLELLIKSAMHVSIRLQWWKKSGQDDREGCTRLIALLMCFSQVKRQLDSCILQLRRWHIHPYSRQRVSKRLKKKGALVFAVDQPWHVASLWKLGTKKIKRSFRFNRKILLGALAWVRQFRVWPLLGEILRQKALHSLASVSSSIKWEE